jgi:hypothetical protein
VSVCLGFEIVDNVREQSLNRERGVMDVLAGMKVIEIS